MKKNTYILSVLLITLLLSSCSLDSKVYNVIDSSLFPQTESDAEALVTASAYGPFRSSGYSGLFSSAQGGIHVIGDMTTDIGDCQWNDVVWADVITHNFTANSGGVTRFYTDYVKEISRITNTFERIARVPMKSETMARMNAELTLSRAWLAFLLYDMYGTIPIATEEQLQDPMGDSPVPRPSKEWMVNFIETELVKSLAGLPDKYEASDASYGRFSKGLAYTILMKLYMHDKQWSKAIEMGRELMKPVYGYKLVPEYKNIFTLENERNSEVIWAAECTRSTNMQLWQAHVMSSMYPTKNPSIQKWGGYRVLWSFYNTFDKDKDKRLEVLVGDFVGTDGKHYHEGNKEGVLAKGAMPIKYGEDPAATGESSQVDWIVYRYADVLTLLSEALVRNGNAVTQEAVDLLNQIRNRAGIDLYKLSDFAGADDFMDKILLNRGQEFWFEGQRRSDLIRHGKYIEFARKYKGSVTTKDHFILFPLPQSAIDEGKGIIAQNPGY